MLPASNRRSFLRGVALSLVADATPIVLTAAGSGEPWTEKWDQRLLQSLVGSVRALYDPSVRGVGFTRSSGQYGDLLASRQAVHPVRESLIGAALLLEAGDSTSVSIALDILDQVLFNPTGNMRQQNGLTEMWVDTDPTLPPADGNMRSFNICFVLYIFYRHGEKLTADLKMRLLKDLSRITASVIHRDVNVYYTNVALLDLFIVFASAEIQGDSNVVSYAQKRGDLIDTTILSSKGGIAEYLCPSYTSQDLMTVTLMKMCLKQNSYRSMSGALANKLWTHLADHWHPPTSQVAGPMLRAYGDRFGKTIWLQKATNNRVIEKPFAQLDLIKFGAEWSTPLLDYACPANVVDRFTVLDEPRQVREVFCPSHIALETGSPGPSGVRPIQGTSYLAPEFSLSTVNQSDLWSQRRPMLLYWGDSVASGVCKVQALKDGQDFATAQFYSAQEKNTVLALINFAAASGDKQSPAAAPVRDPFPMLNLTLAFSVIHGTQSIQLLANGRPVDTRPIGKEDLPAELPLRISWAVGKIQCCLTITGAAFGKSAYQFAISKTPRSFQIQAVLFSSQKTEMIRWDDFREAFLCYSLRVEATSRSLSAFDDDQSKVHPTGMVEQGIAALNYGTLGLRGSSIVRTLAELDQSFQELVNGEPIPLQYLN